MKDPFPPDMSPSRQPDRDGDGKVASVGLWRVPWWALVPASLAPVLLLVGVAVAPSLQPPGFDSVRSSISALAAEEATDRALMTTVVAAVGLAHIGTAISLLGAGLIGRLLLGVAGVATGMVAAFPLPPAGRPSPGHALFAALAVFAVTAWPLGLVPWRSGDTWPVVPYPARPSVAIGASLALVALVSWFGFEQFLRGSYIGLSERIAAVAQATLPLFVVASGRATQRVER